MLTPRYALNLLHSSTHLHAAPITHHRNHRPALDLLPASARQSRGTENNHDSGYHHPPADRLGDYVKHLLLQTRRDLGSTWMPHGFETFKTSWCRFQTLGLPDGVTYFDVSCSSDLAKIVHFIQETSSPPAISTTINL